MKHIDPHVHCRDGRESYKTTIGKVARIAKSQGIAAIFDMPNTDPPILTEKDVVARLSLAKRRKPVVKYFLYVGLSQNKEQIEEAVEVVRKYPEVVGLKLYTSGSVGNLKVTRETNQENIYRILSELNYQGVLAVHCEKEGFFRPRLFNPKVPWTHGLVRPPIAEIEAIRDQIRFAKKTKFKGNLHICHITLPGSVDLVCQAKKDLKITSGVTPHHLLFSEDIMRKSKKGLLYKVNPPLRDQRSRELLLDCLKQRRIDWIETDYALHPLEEKLNPPYRSGIADYSLYGKVLTRLREEGMSQEEIENLTYWNIKRAFEDKLKEV